MKARFGHINDLDIIRKTDEFKLHICVDKKAVNQGVCQIKQNENLYYMKARNNPMKNPFAHGSLKEHIMLEIETPNDKSGYKHADFYVTGLHQSVLSVFFTIFC